MTTVGQIEKKTQARIVALFRDRLGYGYLGNWIDRDNRNIEPELLTTWLKERGVAEPTLMPPERCSILSAVGFNAAGFTGMTRTGRIFSAGSVKFSERREPPVTLGPSCRTISTCCCGPEMR